MATKIKLGNRPKNFPRVIKFPMLDGSEGCIEVTYKYRTRTEFGAFLDELFKAAGVAPAEGEVILMANVMAKTRDSNADYILKVIDGWNLDEPFTPDAVKQLCDELPAASTAIMEGYRLAINEGRLGN